MNILESIKPVELNFKLFEPYIKEKQTKTHYFGHYMKYINNFNKELETNKKLQQIYSQIKKITNNNVQKKTLLLTIYQLFNPDSYLVHNAAQIYNHELYWNTITNNSSIQEYKNKLFITQEQFTNFYNNFIDLGSKHFGSGWMWIIFENNTINVKTTHDAIIPYNDTILGVIDLWEHAYYLDYQSERKKYLENIFTIIDWHRIFHKIQKL